MMNVKHFFSIHHNDLGLFLVQCYTYYRQYKHKCVVHFFENIVFILRTQIHGNILFYFSRKNNVHSVHPIPNQHKVAHTLHTKQQKNLLYTVTVKKKLCCILSSVAVWPQHLIHITSNVFTGHAAGEISPSMVHDFSFLFRRQNTFPTTLCW